MTDINRLPIVIHHGPDLIQRAHDWQEAHAAANTPTPDETYLLVRDLLGAILSPSLAHLPPFPPPHTCDRCLTVHSDNAKCPAPSSPSAGWQNIESAPKDKTLVLVALIRDGVVWRASDAAFNGLGWYTKSGESCHWRTHWMPLPLPPESK